MTTERGPRPKLGKLEVGQPVMVCRNDVRSRKPEDRYIPAIVKKVGRVWVDLVKPGSENWSVYQWRMRMDAQSESTGYASSSTFATLDQHAWDEARTRALGVLQENGIRLDLDSRWKSREIELADLLSKEATA